MRSLSVRLQRSLIHPRASKRNEDAERDCDTVLRIDRKNVKGYFRRGQARVALQKLKEAEAGACSSSFVSLGATHGRGDVKTSKRL